MQIPEKSLLDQAKDRDQYAFVMLIERYTYLIVSVIRQFIHNIIGCEEEDIVQEIKSRAYAIMPHFRGDEIAFRCWLKEWTRGFCLKIIEKQKKYETISLDALGDECALPPFVENQATPADEFRRKETAAHLQQALDALPAPYRKVITLRYLEDLHYHEIADVLGLELGTVQSQIFRATKLLQKQLEYLR